MSLFRAVREALGEREIIAEDLGFITDSVRELVHESGFAGMKILQFGLDGEEEHLSYRYPENSVAFTGTHDNPTLCEWIEAHSEGEIARIRESLWDFFTPRERLYEVLIASLMRSPSRLAIVPMQDYLGLCSEGRMNRPATTGCNWRWRMREEQMSEALAEKIRRLTANGGRLS